MISYIIYIVDVDVFTYYSRYSIYRSFGILWGGITYSQSMAIPACLSLPVFARCQELRVQTCSRSFKPLNGQYAGRIYMYIALSLHWAHVVLHLPDVLNSRSPDSSLSCKFPVNEPPIRTCPGDKGKAFQMLNQDHHVSPCKTLTSK